MHVHTLLHLNVQIPLRVFTSPPLVPTPFSAYCDLPSLTNFYRAVAVHLSFTFGMWRALSHGNVLISLAGDVLLSVVTAYYLLKTRHDVLPSTVGLINALIRLTFTTAAPAAIW